MGRESSCICEWNHGRHAVKALIEPPDLILRGQIRRRLPLSELQQVHAEGDHLRFTFQAEAFSLALGAALASKWATAISAPPPSLAKKLGITPETVVRTIGPVDEDALQAALSTAKAVADKNPGLILARINTPDELASALHAAARQLSSRVPIWFIYPKGRGNPLTENDVRSTALAAGIVDTKVCAVSPLLTALRFVCRKQA